MKAIIIKQPKNSQVVHLHPRQPFTITMPLPANRDKNEVWSSFLPSDYITPVKTVTDDNRMLFSYVQLYDLKKWSHHSCVHLGTIKLSWRGEKRGELYDPAKVITVYVILQAKKVDHHNRLVVINPINEDVRLLPHQILEVVLFNDGDSFNREAPAVDLSNATNEINYETVAIRKTLHNYNPIKEQFSIINGSTDLINRSLASVPVNKDVKHVNPVIKWAGLTYRAFHYYFMTKESDHKKIYGIKNGNYYGGTVYFNDHNESATARDFSVNIDVEVIGSFKKRLGQNHGYKRDLEKPYDIMGHDDRVLTSKSYEKTSTSILNPKHGEAIEFIQGSNKGIVLEMPPPHVFNEKLRGGNSIWRVEVEPIIKISNPAIQMEIKKLDVAAMDFANAEAQRFVISTKQGVLLPSNTNTCLLGVVRLICDDDPSLNRKVICFLVAEKSIIQIAKTIPGGGFSSSRYRDDYHAHRHHTICRPVQPTHFVVKIEPDYAPLEDGCVVTVYESIQDIPEKDIDKSGKSKKKTHVDLQPSFQSEGHLL